MTGENDPFQEENGYFSLRVELIVSDSTAPVIVCNDELYTNCGESFSGPISAEGNDNCTTTDKLIYSWSIDLSNNGEIDSSGIGRSIYASDLDLSEFEVGIHRVVWAVSDDCSNGEICFDLCIKA